MAKFFLRRDIKLQELCSDLGTNCDDDDDGDDDVAEKVYIQL